MSQTKFLCPNCQQKISAGIEVCGTEVACPVCQTPFIAPHPEHFETQAATPQTQPSPTLNPGPQLHPTTAGLPATNIPASAQFLAWYYLLGAIPVILLSLACFAIPADELANNASNMTDGERAFMTGLKVLMFGGLLVYALFHLLGGIWLLQKKAKGYKTAKLLSILGAFHLNPFAVPGLIICSKANVEKFYLGNSNQ